jgi:hypothetical protein
MVPLRRKASMRLRQEDGEVETRSAISLQVSWLFDCIIARIFSSIRSGCFNAHLRCLGGIGEKADESAKYTQLMAKNVISWLILTSNDTVLR